MLLVKSRELKNLSKFSRLQRGCYLIAPLLLLSQTTVAQTNNAAPLSSGSTWVSVFLSLLLVVGVILMIGAVMRRFNVTQSGTGQMQVIASMMVGARERILVIKVGDEQHMVGITPQNINHLSKIDSPISQEVPAAEKMKSKFAAVLQNQFQNTQEKKDEQ